MKPGDVEILRQIAQFEATIDLGKPQWQAGWSWRDVRVWPSTLSRLFKDGYLENVFHSNSHTSYRLSEMGRAVAAAPEAEEASETPQKATIDIPEDIFGDIIGHDEVKEFIRAALTAAGLWDIIAERRPRWLFIDELDKMSAADTAGILSLMEGAGWLWPRRAGRWTARCPSGRWPPPTTWKGSPTSSARALPRGGYPYTMVEFREVVKVVLCRESVAPEVADEIAARLEGRAQDVRDAVRVARPAPQLGVVGAARLLLD